jgi:hypothetical protein
MNGGGRCWGPHQLVTTRHLLEGSCPGAAGGRTGALTESISCDISDATDCDSRSFCRRPADTCSGPDLSFSAVLTLSRLLVPPEECNG